MFHLKHVFVVFIVNHAESQLNLMFAKVNQLNNKPTFDVWKGQICVKYNIRADASSSHWSAHYHLLLLHSNYTLTSILCHNRSCSLFFMSFGNAVMLRWSNCYAHFTTTWVWCAIFPPQNSIKFVTLLSLILFVFAARNTRTDEPEKSFVSQEKRGTVSG